MSPSEDLIAPFAYSTSSSNSLSSLKLGNSGDSSPTTEPNLDFFFWLLFKILLPLRCFEFYNGRLGDN